MAKIKSTNVFSNLLQIFKVIKGFREKQDEEKVISLKEKKYQVQFPQQIKI
jgi:hypothetical protein